MFKSFFPPSRFFFPSVVVWTLMATVFWYASARGAGGIIGLGTRQGPAVIGASRLWSPSFLWFYLYYTVAAGLFTLFWNWRAPQIWWRWSILGSAVILLVTYLQVEVSVTVNEWFGPFYDLIQVALSKSSSVTLGQFYGQLATFAWIALLAVTIGVLTNFFVSHYVFRWRAAMNDWYVARWDALRNIEGAAQRVQEDTMRFANISEDLGVRLIQAVMTLIAFLPVLVGLSTNVKSLPLIGAVPYPLVVAALLWSAFGTAFLALIGIRLPGLNFANQKVEAAFRKELVYGEDDPGRAHPVTLRELFAHVRANYFRLYFHYLYFNIGRILYLQTDSIFPYIILGPVIVIGAITLGVMNQILRAFDEVRTSFQYLVTSWTTIIELLSIYKRLRMFEKTLAEKRVAP